MKPIRSRLPMQVIKDYWADVTAILVQEFGLGKRDAVRSVANYRRTGVRLGIGDIQYHNSPHEVAKGIIQGGYTEIGIRASRQKLPSKTEIADLPLSARVALATRCAERVLPLVLMSLEADSRSNELVSRVYRIVRGESGGLAWGHAPHPPEQEYLLDSTFDCISQAERVIESAATARAEFARARQFFAHVEREKIAFPQQSVHSRAIAEESKERAEFAGKQVTLSTARAIRSAVIGVGQNKDDPEGRQLLENAISRDFENLQRLAREGPWAIDSTVPDPRSALGPLWPEDPPVWWFVVGS